MANVTKAQLAIMLTAGFAVAFMGWAVVYLASSQQRPPRANSEGGYAPCGIDYWRPETDSAT
jgi:hypothetical protein